eukprot:SAG31_NODE_1213_length_9359_cov_4.298164_5_plen_80_part_00
MEPVASGPTISTTAQIADAELRLAELHAQEQQLADSGGLSSGDWWRSCSSSAELFLCRGREQEKLRKQVPSKIYSLLFL